MKPICIDLFCGLGGWTEGFLAEGYQVIGFDNHRHEYGEHRYPGELVIQDVLTLHGSQFQNAACIVASPPCQQYSYMAQPWTRAKREIRWQEWERDSPFGNFQLADLFNACLRIQREACEAATRDIPMVIENVVGAQRWVGRAQWHYGSYYLWGDVPAIMPFTSKLKNNGKTLERADPRDMRRDESGEWVNAPNGVTKVGNNHPGKQFDGVKNPGMNWSDRSKPSQGFNVTNAQRYRDSVKVPGNDTFASNGMPYGKLTARYPSEKGLKQGGNWWHDPESMTRKFSSRSDSRKAASALIAKIPFELSSYIARVYKP